MNKSSTDSLESGIAFTPYENEHQSMQIGELIIENQLDKVIVYGDLEISKSEKGLEQAVQFQKVINDIVKHLEKAKVANQLPSHIKGSKQNGLQSSNEVDNPFS